MDNIRAGIVCVTKFVSSNSKKFSKYIDYIDRDMATRKSKIKTYNVFDGYLDYMDNDLKTIASEQTRLKDMSEIFTKNKDKLDKEEKKYIKELFKKAQGNSSLLWQTVISFDNRWLEKTGIYNVKTGYLDEKRLKNVSAMAINKMLANEKLENALWTACIHYNTDNIHIHVAIAEIIPHRETKMYRQYKIIEDKNNPGKYKKVQIYDKNGREVLKKEKKGTFKLSSIKKLKSVLLNELENNKEITIEINDILRNIVKTKKEISLFSDSKIAKNIENLYFNISYSLKNGYINSWSYSRLRPFQEDINYISSFFTEKYFKNDFEKMIELIDTLEENQKLAYGSSNFKKNKIDEFYKRLGNGIVKELREIYLKDIEAKKASNNAKKTMEKGSVLSNKKIFIDASIRIKRSLLQEKDKYLNELDFELLQNEIAIEF